MTRAWPPTWTIPHYTLCERLPAAAARTLANFPREGYANMGVNFPHARWEGDAAHAQTAFVAARAELEKVLADKPDAAPTSASWA